MMRLKKKKNVSHISRGWWFPFFAWKYFLIKFTNKLQSLNCELTNLKLEMNDFYIFPFPKIRDIIFLPNSEVLIISQREVLHWVWWMSQCW